MRKVFKKILFLFMVVCLTGGFAPPLDAARNDDSLKTYVKNGKITAAEAKEIKAYLKKELKSEIIKEIREELKKEAAFELESGVKKELISELNKEKAEEKERLARENKKQKDKELKLSVYSQFLYSDDNTPGAGSGFSVSRTRLTLSEKTENGIEFYTQGNLSSNSASNSRFTMLEATVQYYVRPDFQFRLGQFLVPLGIENPLGSKKVHMINYSQVSNNADHENVSDDSRDVGARFLFEEKDKPFNLVFAIVNGEGINRRNDSNDKKDFSGRLGYKKGGYLDMGVSAYEGRRFKNAAAPNSIYGASAAATAAGDFTRKRTAFDFRYCKNKWLWQSEYYLFETGMAGRAGNLKGKGGYLETGYFIYPKFELALKGDIFTPDTSIPDSKRTIYAYGFNFYPAKFAKLQFVYENRREEAGRELNNDLVATQLTLEY